jgi:hypothetical protein
MRLFRDLILAVEKETSVGFSEMVSRKRGERLREQA